MKTAEQWWIEGRSKARSETEVVKLLKQIQIDALREAAEIVKPTPSTYKDDIEPWLGLHDFNLATGLHNAILSRIKELEKEA